MKNTETLPRPSQQQMVRPLHEYWPCPCCGDKLEINYGTGEWLRTMKAMLYPDYLKTAWWKLIRKLALIRYEGRCALCSQTERLEVHHRTYQNLGAERPNDVIVLCAKCHGKHHSA